MNSHSVKKATKKIKKVKNILDNYIVWLYIIFIKTKENRRNKMKTIYKVSQKQVSTPTYDEEFSSYEDAVSYMEEIANEDYNGEDSQLEIRKVIS